MDYYILVADGQALAIFEDHRDAINAGIDWLREEDFISTFEQRRAEKCLSELVEYECDNSNIRVMISKISRIHKRLEIVESPDITFILRQEVWKYLPVISIFSLSQVCKELQKIWQDPLTWRHLILRDFRISYDLDDVRQVYFLMDLYNYRFAVRYNPRSEYQSMGSLFRDRTQ